MLKIKNGLNLKERRYKVYECPLCGSIFAVRKSNGLEEFMEGTMYYKAQERIDMCDTCGCDNLMLRRFGDDHQEYINLVRPCIEKNFLISNNQMVMEELYILDEDE